MDGNDGAPAGPRRKLYGRRHGKRLKESQKRLLEELLPRLRIPGVGEDDDLDFAALFGERPVWLHHGSSVSHGSDAASPTTTWPAIAAHRGDLELINLGFGGGALLDPFTARTMRAAPADHLIVADGTSCRHQIGDLSPRQAIHSVRVLDMALGGAAR